MTKINARETRIGEETVSAIDFMSRLIGAIEGGNWHYANDKARQLQEVLPRLRAQLERTDQNAVGPQVVGLVERESQHYRIGRALYGSAGQSSPLAQAEDAKRRRDLRGEVGAVIDGYAALTSAPWYPAREGDVVHVAYGAIGDISAFGETYLVVDDEDEGGMVLRLLAHTGEEGAVGCFMPGTVNDPLSEMWMESGSHTITVVRDGVVVHGGSR